MCHQSQTGFCGSFIGIPQHQKGYLIYVLSTRKTVSSHGIVFVEILSSVLAYTSCLYLEALYMQQAVLYIIYATSYHEKTANIKSFAQF